MLRLYARKRVTQRFLLGLALLGTMILPTVWAQTSTNPAFWQEPIMFNVSDSSDNGSIVSTQSRVAISQDFQTVLASKDDQEPNSRFLFDFGYCCLSSNTTLQSIQNASNNSLLAAPVRSQSKMALVQRGYCNWTEKLSVVANLSSTYNLYVTAVLIYDNDTHANAPQVSLQATSGQTSAPSYPSALPADRSIANMSDNNVDVNQTQFPVYFAPNVYGQELIQLLHSGNNVTGDLRTFWQLTTILDTVDWNDGNGEDQGAFLNALAMNRGYVSYIIALAAIFIIGVIVLRWWRLRRVNGVFGQETAVHNTNMYIMQRRVTHPDPLSADIVNTFQTCKYMPDVVKNTGCAICLEDFVVNVTEVRILPCGHGFCMQCIDPWLMQKSTLCPVCKWDCSLCEKHASESHEHDSSEEQQSDAEDRTSIDMSDADSTPNHHFPMNNAQAEPSAPHRAGSTDQLNGLRNPSHSKRHST